MSTLMGAPLRRIEVDRGKFRMEKWPFTIPAVRELIENGFEPAEGSRCSSVLPSHRRDPGGNPDRGGGMGDA